jgi:membrane protein implicated in regulation of membrane protease activity
MLRTLTRNQLVTDLAIAGVFFLLFGLFAMLAGADIARTSVAFGMATALALAVE